MKKRPHSLKNGLLKNLKQLRQSKISFLYFIFFKIFRYKSRLEKSFVEYSAQKINYLFLAIFNKKIKDKLENLRIVILGNNRTAELSVKSGEISGDEIDCLLRKTRLNDLNNAERRGSECDRYLSALVEVQRRLLTFDGSLQCYTELLKLIGQASRASRTYLFENHRDTAGNLLASQRAEWLAEGIHVDIDNDTLQNFSYEKFFPRWKDLLLAGGVCAGIVADFPESERLLWESRGIVSILFVPIIVKGNFLGVIGFENCIEGRTWESAEVYFSSAAAAYLSLTLERFQAENEMKTFNNNLENRVQERTSELKKANEKLQEKIADRQQKEAELEKLLSLQQAAIESTGDGILVVENTGKIAIFNQKLIEMWNISEGSIASVYDERSLAFVLERLETPKNFTAKVRDLSAQPEAEMVDVIEFKDGRTFEGYSRPHKIGGKTVGRVWAFRDISDRKQVEKARLENEERCRQIAENIDGVFWMSEPCKPEKIDISPACEQIGSRTCESAVEQPSSYLDTIHPDDRDRVVAAFKKELQGQPVQIEYRIVRPDGLIRWICDRGFSIFHQSGQVYRFGGIAQDITNALLHELASRKQIEEALQLSEERFRIAASCATDLIYEWDIFNGRLEWFGNIDEQLGYLPGEFPRTLAAWEKIVHPDDLERVMAAVEQHLQAGKPYSEEYRVQRKDGIYIYWAERGTALRDEKGNSYKWIGAVSNITDRKLSEAVLRSSEERFRQLAENIQEFFWISNPEFSQIIYVSPAYERIWGHPPEELYLNPRACLDAVHPDDRDRVFTAFLSPEELNEQYRILRPDGSVRWIYTRGFPIKNGQGKIYRIAGISEDITYRVGLEAELRRGAKERELSQLKTRFVSMVSHEFRTPLTAILSSADLLEYYLEECPDEKNNKKLEHLKRIQTAAVNMTHLLEDVLLLGKAEAGRLAFNPNNLDLVEFCRALVEEVEVTADNAIALYFARTPENASEPDSCPPACMDEKLLRQLFTNLLSNAVKYSPGGGEVNFSLTCTDTEAIFQIQDRGIGIPPEELPHLFESFHRCRNVGTIPGTGLGLTIVKRCVDLHGGQIDVESQLGAGTTFTVKLPLTRELCDRDSLPSP